MPRRNIFSPALSALVTSGVHCSVTSRVGTFRANDTAGATKHCRHRDCVLAPGRCLYGCQGFSRRLPTLSHYFTPLKDTENLLSSPAVHQGQGNDDRWLSMLPVCTKHSAVFNGASDAGSKGTSVISAFAQQARHCALALKPPQTGLGCPSPDPHQDSSQRTQDPSQAPSPSPCWRQPLLHSIFCLPAKILNLFLSSKICYSKRKQIGLGI